jgi:hypothetical protein
LGTSLPERFGASQFATEQLVSPCPVFVNGFFFPCCSRLKITIQLTT